MLVKRGKMLRFRGLNTFKVNVSRLLPAVTIPNKVKFARLLQTAANDKLKTNSRKIIFSGIQPTGYAHIGNYLGALKQWVDYQNDNECIYCIVDLHSITTSQESEQLRENIRNMAMCMLACGVNPERALLFQQSSVSEHTELSWIFSCLATLPQLNHQPQWREKSASLKTPSVGLFTYPILQSADILLYKATHVPVGEDQLKHIELTRHIARTFNKRFDASFFQEPEAILTSTKRVRSLRKPDQKMSKSEPDCRSRIDLNDSPEVIREKVKKSVTDTLGKLTYDCERPGVVNLIDIHSSLTGMEPDRICTECSSMNMSTYKLHLADIIIESLRPIREELEKLESDSRYVDVVLENGAEKARSIALENMLSVKKLIGFAS